MYLINTEITRRSTNILETIDVSKSYHLLDMVDRMEKAIIEKKEGEFFEIFNENNVKAWHLLECLLYGWVSLR